MKPFNDVLSIIARVVFLFGGFQELMKDTPDRNFILLCFAMSILITIERGVEGIRSALEFLVTVKNEMDNNKKETT